VKPSNSILKRNVGRLPVVDVRMMGDAGLRLNRIAWYCIVLHGISLKCSTVLCSTVLCMQCITSY
jgi:hypothetical protein